MPLTRLPLTTGVSGTLPIANGGTNVTTAADLANTGNLVLLSTATASDDATVNFDNTVITSSYNDYVMIGTGVRPATDVCTPRIAPSTDNGSNFTNSDTGRNWIKTTGAAGGFERATGNYIEMGFSLGNDADLGGSFRCDFYNLNVSGMYKWGICDYVAKHSADAYKWDGGYSINTTSAINYLRFEFSTGNIAEGEFRFYGVKT